MSFAPESPISAAILLALIILAPRFARQVWYYAVATPTVGLARGIVVGAAWCVFGWFFLISGRELAWSTAAVHPVPLWCCVVVALAAVGLAFSSGRAQRFLDVQRGERWLPELARREPSGPYRWCRFPGTVAFCVFAVALSILTCRWILVPVGFLTCAILRLVIVPWEDRLLARRGGADYANYAAATGLFCPKANLQRAEYVVPRRFSVAAVLALMTTQGILFGALKAMEAHPAVYLFCASQVMAICLAQILFEKVPRRSSIAAGALLLPFWYFALVGELATFSRAGGLTRDAMILFWLMLLGGAFGYLTGVLAAGFFLVTDLLEDAAGKLFAQGLSEKGSDPL